MKELLFGFQKTTKSLKLDYFNSSYGHSSNTFLLSPTHNKVELARHLLPAFDTPSGVPSPIVNLKYGLKTSSGQRGIRPLSVAEAGTLQLEFRDVSKASGRVVFMAAIISL